jgi:site-specific recombinase XerD
MAQNGVPLWEICGMLGHSMWRTTELYAHHHPDHLKNAREGLERRRAV